MLCYALCGTLPVYAQFCHGRWHSWTTAKAGGTGWPPTCATAGMCAILRLAMLLAPCILCCSCWFWQAACLCDQRQQRLHPRFEQAWSSRCQHRKQQLSAPDARLPAAWLGLRTQLSIFMCTAQGALVHNKHCSSMCYCCGLQAAHKLAKLLRAHCGRCCMRLELSSASKLLIACFRTASSRVLHAWCPERAECQ